MPQSSERKKAYAKERRAVKGAELNAKYAEWAAANRAHLRAKATQRRAVKRAMCLVAAARVRARQKGIAFEIDCAEIERLQRVIDAGCCELSGVPFTLTGPRSATSPSLDRIRPGDGYVPGNLRVVCHALNAGMGDWGEVALLRIARAWVARDGNAIVAPQAEAFIGAYLNA